MRESTQDNGKSGHSQLQAAAHHQHYYDDEDDFGEGEHEDTQLVNNREGAAAADLLTTPNQRPGKMKDKLDISKQ